MQHRCRKKKKKGFVILIFSLQHACFAGLCVLASSVFTPYTSPNCFISTFISLFYSSLLGSFKMQSLQLLVTVARRMTVKFLIVSSAFIGVYIYLRSRTSAELSQMFSLCALTLFMLVDSLYKDGVDAQYMQYLIRYCKLYF